jgi:hypothetical protein
MASHPDGPVGVVALLDERAHLPRPQVTRHHPACMDRHSHDLCGHADNSKGPAQSSSFAGRHQPIRTRVCSPVRLECRHRNLQVQAEQALRVRTHGARLHGAGAAGGGEQRAGGKSGGAGAALLQVPQPTAQHEALVRRQAPAHDSHTVEGQWSHTVLWACRHPNRLAVQLATMQLGSPEQGCPASGARAAVTRRQHPALPCSRHGNIQTIVH